MREITIFPGCIMAISCPNCQGKGTFTFQRPPTQDFVAKCPKCQERFKIKLNVRKSYRKEISILVVYSFRDIDTLDAASAFSGKITDFSKDGMSVESSSSWFGDIEKNMDAILTFMFLLPPKNEKVKVRGQIKRLKKLEGKGIFSMGIQFCDLDDGIARKIGFFLWN